MKSHEYKQNIRNIVRSVIRRKYPGVKKPILEEIATDIAKGIHARFYGANVDGVESPIWRDNKNYDFEQPIIDASDLLKMEI